MSDTYTEQLRQTFAVAALNREARLNLSGNEWRQYRDIHDEFTKARTYLIERYEAEYDTRIEAARKRLIDQAAGKDRAFTYPHVGRDRFDKSAIDRQARREVRREHLGDIRQLEHRERETKDAFLDDCTHRQDLKKDVKRDFRNATDRRKLIDRRKPQQWRNRPSRKRDR
ncbi:hypothetical protein ACFQ14_12625 [Pseudahrensia aquimaris]|uniref:Uncharacterized protein n=1 Tax=Pseudahrensia aquimaris TaxID=744461 RepID=A0ABW3FHZ8_9HYPH